MNLLGSAKGGAKGVRKTWSHVEHLGLHIQRWHVLGHHVGQQLVVVRFLLDLVELQIVGNRVLLLAHLLVLSKHGCQSVLTDACNVGSACLAMSEAENAALFGASGALTPTDVVRAGLAWATRIVAKEAFLLFAVRADHRMRVLARVVSLLALLSIIDHT